MIAKGNLNVHDYSKLKLVMVRAMLMQVRMLGTRTRSTPSATLFDIIEDLEVQRPWLPHPRRVLGMIQNSVIDILHRVGMYEYSITPVNHQATRVLENVVNLRERATPDDQPGEERAGLMRGVGLDLELACRVRT